MMFRGVHALKSPQCSRASNKSPKTNMKALQESAWECKFSDAPGRHSSLQV